MAILILNFASLIHAVLHFQYSDTSQALLCFIHVSFLAVICSYSLLLHKPSSLNFCILTHTSNNFHLFTEGRSWTLKFRLWLKCFSVFLSEMGGIKFSILSHSKCSNPLCNLLVIYLHTDNKTIFSVLSLVSVNTKIYKALITTLLWPLKWVREATGIAGFKYSEFFPN